jgi:hypothetical protein
MNAVPTYHLTNALRCIPVDEKWGEPRAPTEEEANACWFHLQQVYFAVKPKFTVFLGRTAELLCKARIPGGTRVHHPAFVLRSGGTNSSQYRELIRELADMFAKSKKGKTTWKR